MSKLRRATLALVALVVVFVGLTAAYGGRAPQPQLASEPSATPELFARTFETATPFPTATPQPPTPTFARRPIVANDIFKVAPTSFLPGKGPELSGEQVASGRRLDFYVGKNTFSPEQVARLSYDVEHALSYIQKRFQVALTKRVSIGVYRTSNAPKRGVRGMAYTSNHIINIYYRPEDDEFKAVVILSHELAHQLEAEYYGSAAQSSADTILHEGLATWISGEYWLSLSDATNWQQRAKQLHDSGMSMNLPTAERNGPDAAYEIWAGFVDYLTRAYGWDAFHELYKSGRGRACGSANYKAIYGKTLAELNDEWVATLQ